MVARKLIKTPNLAKKLPGTKLMYSAGIELWIEIVPVSVCCVL